MLSVLSTKNTFSFTFSIDGHNMTIIEADGVETRPVTVDSITIYAAQRYSVIVHANQKIGNYCKFSSDLVRIQDREY